LFVAPNIKVRGVKVASWRVPNRVEVDKDSWFFFVDEQPGANWEHQAKYILVDKISGIVRSFKAKTPPREILKLKPENPVAVNQLEMLKRTAKLYREVRLERLIKLSVQEKYALLVSGGWNASYNYSRYWNDLAFIYKALKKKYKYTDDEIIVLYANGAI
jgi:hypothetical protein